MLAYLHAEQGGSSVLAMLRDPNSLSYAHAVNILEVYYDILRSASLPAARKALRTLKAEGVIIRRDLAEAFLQDVGALKARGSIALADCFCLALARRLGGEVVTTDHKEMDPLVPLGICPIHFIR